MVETKPGDSQANAGGGESSVGHGRIEASSALAREVFQSALDRRGLIRRVASGRFIDGRLLRWSVSLDADLGVLPTHPAYDEGPTLLPLGFFTKETFQAFSARNEAGAALPLASGAEVSRLVVRAICDSALDRVVSDEEWAEIWLEFGKVARSQPTKFFGDGYAIEPRVVAALVAARRWVDNEQELALAATERIDDLALKAAIDADWLHFLSDNYLAVALVDGPRRRRVIKYSYEFEVEPDRAWGARGSLQVRVGWRPEMIRLEVGGFHTSSSSHLELFAPESTDILVAEYSDHSTNGNCDPVGNSVHMHFPEEPTAERYRDLMVRVSVQSKSRPQFNYGFVPGAVSSLVMGGLWYMSRRVGLDASADLLAAILFGVPALAYAQLLFGRASHYASRLLSGTRWTTFAAAAVMFLGAVSALIPNVESRSWYWSRLTVVSLVISYQAAVALYALRVRKQAFAALAPPGKLTFARAPVNWLGKARYRATLESTPPLRPFAPTG